MKTLIYKLASNLAVYQVIPTPLPPGVNRISHALILDEITDTPRAYWMADCFDPAITIVHAYNEEDGFDEWLSRWEPHYLVSPTDKDYSEEARENLHYTDGGDLYDIDAASSSTAELIAVIHRDISAEQLEQILNALGRNK